MKKIHEPNTKIKSMTKDNVETLLAKTLIIKLSSKFKYTSV